MGEALLRLRINALGIVAAALVILAGAVIAVDGGLRHTRRVHALLSDAPDVRAGTRVLDAGVDVGVVQRVSFAAGGVAVDMDIDRTDVSIGVQDSVRVATTQSVEYGNVKLAVGSHVLEIVPGPFGTPRLTSGDTLRAASPRLAAAKLVIDPRRLRDSLAGLLHQLRADSAALARSLHREPR